MPKLYIAEEQIQSHETAETPRILRKVACKSMTVMKTRLREFPETTWTIKTVTVKTDAASLCSLLEGVELVTEATENVKINTSGQVRSVK